MQSIEASWRLGNTRRDSPQIPKLSSHDYDNEPPLPISRGGTTTSRRAGLRLTL